MARSIVLLGVDGHVVDVEADLAQGLPGFTLVGLPDVSLHEARDRVRAAVVNSGQSWPNRKITVNLSPASLPKRGSSLDLAIASAVLSASGALRPGAFARTVLLGELGLDGRLRPVRGVLPAVAAAVRAGLRHVVVPEPNRGEACLVPGVHVDAVSSVRQLVALANGEAMPDEPLPDQPLRAVGQAPGGQADDDGDPSASSSSKDLSDIVGQEMGRWALEVAAAGAHHLLLLGPPGAGKTMLAERLPGLLPDLDRMEALEVTSVHSVAGLLRPGVPLVTRPPYQAPHHTATTAAIVGGGSGVPRPGAASLAHRGVLFLDEAPEFAPSVLEALRQPLESGSIVLARSAGTASYPARFRLVLAANPCPCGHGGGKGLHCRCPPLARRRYLTRLSGPLLDRVDLRLTIPALTRADLAGRPGGGEGTAAVAARVHAARQRALRRYAGTQWRTNAEVPGRELRRHWPADAAGTETLERDLARGVVSMRGADRVLRVAWTLADLSGRRAPGAGEVHSALALRLMEASAA